MCCIKSGFSLDYIFACSDLSKDCSYLQLAFLVPDESTKSQNLV